mgnify:CR=1 FL=1
MSTLLEDMSAKLQARESARTAALAPFIAAAASVGADWELKVTTAEQLRIVLDAVGGHDNYNHRQVTELLGPIIGDASEVRVEQFTGGPAITVQVPFWTGQTIAAGRSLGLGTGVPYLVEERQAFAERVRAIGKACRADEISVRQGPGSPDVVWGGTGDRPREVRLWWD